MSLINQHAWINEVDKHLGNYFENLIKDLSSGFIINSALVFKAGVLAECQNVQDNRFSQEIYKQHYNLAQFRQSNGFAGKQSILRFWKRKPDEIASAVWNY